jgi:hypothetical protein
MKTEFLSETLVMKSLARRERRRGKDHPDDQFNPARFGLNNTNTQTGGYTTLSGGLSIGTKIGGTYSHTKTWLFND